MGTEAVERRRCGMAIVVACPDRDDGDGRRRRGQQGVGRGRPAAVVSDLQQVDVRQAPRHEHRVHVLFGVPGEQEAPPIGFAEQHDRRVVDAAAGGRGLHGHRPRVRPEHTQRQPVDADPVTRRNLFAPQPGRAQRRSVGRVAWPISPHARLGDPPHPIAGENGGEAGRVVVVRVREDDEVEAAVPRRQPGVEDGTQAAWIRPAIDEDPGIVGGSDQDRVALAHVEHDDVKPSVGTRGRRRDHHREAERETGSQPLHAARLTGPTCRTRAGGGPGDPGPAPASHAATPRGRAPDDEAAQAFAHQEQAQSRRGDAGEDRAGPVGQGQSGKRQRRCEPDHLDHDPEHDSSGDARERHDDAGPAGHCEQPRAQGDHPCRHRGGHQRHDHQVQEWREERQAPERGEHDRQRRSLRRQRHREAFDGKGWQPWRPPPDAIAQWARPRQEAGGGGRRQLEPGVGHAGRRGDEQEQDGPAERPRGSAGPPDLAGDEGHGRHHGRPEDRWRRARQDRVGADRQEHDDGPGAPRSPGQEPAHEPGHQGDVPAGDRDHVGEPGRREGGREVRVDSLAESDQDAGGKTRRRLRQCPRQRVSGRRPDRLDRPRRRPRHLQHDQLAGPERCRDARRP